MGECHEIFDFRFFHESVSPEPLSIPLGPVTIFFEIRRDFAVQGAQMAKGILKKSSIRKVFNYFIWSPLCRVNI
jgi:hypothetical protein